MKTQQKMAKIQFEWYKTDTAKENIHSHSGGRRFTRVSGKANVDINNFVQSAQSDTFDRQSIAMHLFSHNTHHLRCFASLLISWELDQCNSFIHCARQSFGVNMLEWLCTAVVLFLVSQKKARSNESWRYFNKNHYLLCVSQSTEWIHHLNESNCLTKHLKMKLKLAANLDKINNSMSDGASSMLT